MHLLGVLGALMQTRRDVIPNRPRIEEAIVNAQSQLPILLERKHDRRRRGRDTMAKKFRHPTRRVSAVAAQSDDAQLQGRADERSAGCPPVTAVYPSWCTRGTGRLQLRMLKGKIVSRSPKQLVHPALRVVRASRHVLHVHATSTGASTSPMSEPSAEPTIRYCLSISLFYVFSDATVLSPSFHPCLQRYFPTLIISIFAPERIAEPLATKYNDLSLPQVLMFPHHTLRSTNLHGTLTTPSDAPTQPSWPAHHTLQRYNTTFMARSPI